MFDFLPEFTSRPSIVFRMQILAGTRCKPWNGEIRGFAPGETVDVSAEEGQMLLIGGKAARIGTVTPDGTFLADPPMADRSVSAYSEQPYPSAWSSLPAEFRKAWGQREELKKLQAELAALREGASVAGLEHVGGGDGAEAAAAHARLDRIASAENRLRRFDRRALARACYQCGVFAAAEIHSANRACAEVAELGFEIFSLRLAPLELGEAKRRALFGGSGTWAKYPAALQPLGEHDMRRAGGERFVDASLEQMADRVFQARAKLAHALELRKEALAEREKTAGIFGGLRRAK